MYITNNPYELYHHGILGQKWGKKNGPPYPLSKSQKSLSEKRKGLENLKKSKGSNIEKWGKDADHNVLYISGYSGSGKSTSAINMAKRNDKIIHLDSYTEASNPELLKMQSREFNSFLNKKVPNWNKMTNATSTGENGSLKRFSEEYWDIVDEFREAIEEFGRQQFKNGSRIIVEGVQIADDWLTDNKKYYTDKPIILLQTNRFNSLYRSFTRDSKGIDAINDYLKTARVFNKKINELIETTDAVKIRKRIFEEKLSVLTEVKRNE